MTGAGSEATSGLREALEAEMVAALDSEASEGMDIETLARYVVDLQVPVVLEAVEQAEKDTAEKEQGRILAALTAWANENWQVYLGGAVVRECFPLTLVARSGGGGTPEQGEASG